MIYSEKLEVEVDQRVWPELKLVVFVPVRNTTLEQSRTFKVSNCPAHLVRSSWSESTVSPGTPVTFTVSSRAGSLCGVSAVDKVSGTETETESAATFSQWSCSVTGTRCPRRGWPS